MIKGLKKFGINPIVIYPDNSIDITSIIKNSGIECIPCPIAASWYRPELVLQNTEKYASQNIQFIKLDIVKSKIPNADFILYGIVLSICRINIFLMQPKT